MFKPVKNLTKEERNIILYGSDEPISYSIELSNGKKVESQEYIEGVANLIKRRYHETTSEAAREFYSKFMSNIPCNVCHGKKLSDESLSVKINETDIIELTEKNITSLSKFFLELSLSESDQKIANLALCRILSIRANLSQRHLRNGSYRILKWNCRRRRRPPARRSSFQPIRQRNFCAANLSPSY